MGWIQAKAMTAFLSGEMKDTVEINPAGSYGAFLQGDSWRWELPDSVL